MRSSGRVLACGYQRLQARSVDAQSGQHTLPRPAPAPPEALRQEIASITSRLYVLPDATKVLPGHGPTTTIGESKAEYAVFASKPHPADLKGDVLWRG